MGKIISAVVILVLIIGGVLLFRNKSAAPTDMSTATTTSEAGMDMTVDATATTSAATSTGSVTADNVKEFAIDASNFKFSLSNLSVNKGDKVRITVTDIGGTHNLKIDEFGVETKMLQTGDKDTIEFVADKTGSFQYYCSVGSHRAMGMWGTLTVK